MHPHSHLMLFLMRKIMVLHNCQAEATIIILMQFTLGQVKCMFVLTDINLKRPSPKTIPDSCALPLLAESSRNSSVLFLPRL